MTIQQMQKWQQNAIKTLGHKSLDLRTQIALSKSVALWEQAIQVAHLNELLRRKGK
jgi:hypothetical protein